MTTPKRHRFRLSLRSLLIVVTIAGLCFGFIAYQLNWIRRRHEAMDDWYKRFGCGPVVAAFGQVTSTRGTKTTTEITAAPPWGIRIFGEPGYKWIAVGVADGDWASEDMEIKYRVEKLFPEAQVQFHTGPPPPK